MDSIEELDGTAWVMFTWPVLGLLVLVALLLGVVLGALIERART